MITSLSKLNIWSEFEASKDYREAFVEENVYISVAAQLTVLREQRELSQTAAGKLVGMAQERISILEDPNSQHKPTLKTLLKFAAGFDCGLEVRFVPISKVLDDSFRIGEAEMRVDSFNWEKKQVRQKLSSAARTGVEGAVISIDSYIKGSNPANPQEVPAMSFKAVLEGHYSQAS